MRMSVRKHDDQGGWSSRAMFCPIRTSWPRGPKPTLTRKAQRPFGNLEIPKGRTDPHTLPPPRLSPLAEHRWPASPHYSPGALRGNCRIEVTLTRPRQDCQVQTAPEFDRRALQLTAGRFPDIVGPVQGSG